MLDTYAVMGNPIDHSLSPIIHHAFAAQTEQRLVYEKICIDPDNFPSQVTDFFKKGGKGLNITLPCKQQAYEMSEVHTKRCEQAGAANTLWMHDGQLHADNTDGIGLLRDLARFIPIASKSILILGAGGAAHGIIGPLLSQRPARIMIANRTLAKAAALKTQFPDIMVCDLVSLSGSGDYDVIINATSLSLAGHTIELPGRLMQTRPFCYDLAYDIRQDTPFVHQAKQSSCQATDGLGMLVEQAAEAFYIWRGMVPDTRSVLSQLRKKISDR